MNKHGITAAGTWIVDYTKIVSQFPTEGACTTILTETVSNGGAPYNLLIDLCRLGAPFPLRAIGCVGRDIDGANILKDCHSHNIDANLIRITEDAATSFSDVMTAEQTGVRTSFNHAAANAYLDTTDFNKTPDLSRIFYLGTLFFLKNLDSSDDKHGTKAASVLAAKREAGLITCVDIERCDHVTHSAFVEGCLHALKHTDIVIVNIEVCEQLTGLRLRIPTGVDLRTAGDAAKILAKIGNAKQVVIRFPAGALALQEDGCVVTEGSVQVPNSRRINMSGVGHGFAAGFLYGVHENWAPAQSLKAAHATAAACLMDGTPSGGIRIMSSCLELITKYGQR